MKGTAAFLAALLLSGPADAYLKAGPAGYGHWLQGAIAPLDGGGAFTTPAAAYSMRRLKSTYAGPGLKLRRATGGTQDINFLGFSGFTGAPIDTAAANAFCASTTCFIDTWYDQSGNARHMLQPTAGSQPQYIGACKGSLPCAQETATAQNMSVASVAPSAVISLSAVAQHAVRPGGCVYISVNFSNNLYQDPTTDVLHLQGTGGINAPATGLAWHSHTATTNGAASVVNIDGTETAGTVSVAAGAGPLYFSPQAAGATCNNAEMIWWDGYALTGAERAALQANQKSFWGTP
jgi:hypothetical protein